MRENSSVALAAWRPTCRDRPVRVFSPTASQATGAAGGRATALLAATGAGLVLAAMAFGAIHIVREDAGSGAGLGAALALLPVPAYLAVVLWVDRVEPEPPLLLAAAFAWGAGSAFTIAYTLNTAGTLVVGEIHGAHVGAIYFQSVSAPVVEETLKALPLFALLAFAHDRIDGPVDGVVYAAVAALGFATTENALYYGRAAVEGGLPEALDRFILRGVWNPAMHPMCTAATGIGVAYAAVRRGRVRLLAAAAGLGFAIVLHSAWNTSITVGWYPVVYYALFMPLLAALAAIVVAVRARDTRVLAAHLPAALGRERVEAELGSPAGRRALRAVARRRGGASGRRLAIAYERTAIELAFLERRVALGHRRADPDGARRRALRDRFLALEAELRRLQILSAAGPVVAAHGPLVHRERLRVWFGVSLERDLVVHVSNTGGRPLVVEEIALAGPPWRRGEPVTLLPAPVALVPGGRASRIVPARTVVGHARSGRRWVYARTERGRSRARRIPPGVLDHLSRDPDRAGSPPPGR